MKKYMYTLFILFTYSHLCFSQHWNTEQLDSLLCEVHDKDQHIRVEFNKKHANQPPTQEEVVAYIEELGKVDKANQDFVSSILDSIGWPPNLSTKANLGVFLVIDHGKKQYAEKYVELVHKQACEGVIPMHLYATLYDRILMKNGKKQLYGTQTLMLPGENGNTNMYLWPIETEEGIDELRKEAGFNTLEEYFVQLKNAYGKECIWDKELKIEDIPEFYYNH